MRRIKDDNPFYTDDLYRRYLSAQSSSFLSKEESEWIGQHGAIRIGYLNQDGGISSVDPSTGKLDRCYYRLCGSCRKLSARSDSGI